MSCSKDDFDQILTNIEEFWGSGRTLHLHHPMFINEFGNTAFIFKERSKVCAYLFGFYSQTQPVAYVHLIAVRNNYRKLGLGRKLYEHFIKCAREKLCSKIKAITKPTNLESIAFHKIFRFWIFIQYFPQFSCIRTGQSDYIPALNSDYHVAGKRQLIIICINSVMNGEKKIFWFQASVETGEERHYN